MNCTSTNHGNEGIEGEWVSQDDNSWSLSISKDSIVDSYDGEVIAKCTYSIDELSCDTAYSIKNYTYLKTTCDLDEVTCYEITSLNASTFSYRETTTGNLFIFNRD